jgi:hypothetical protein
MSRFSSRARFLVSATGAALAPTVARAQTYTWTGMTNSVWGTGSNWTPDTGCPTCAPGEGALVGANASIPAGVATIISTGNQKILGTLSVGASQTPGQFRLQLGGLGFSVAFASLTDTLVASGVTIGPLEFRGNSSWQGGTLSGTGTIGVVEGTLSITQATLTTAGFNNLANVVQNGTMLVEDTSIGNSGTWRFDGSGTIGRLGPTSAAVFNNHGRLGRWPPSSGLKHNFDVLIDNSGTIECSAGTFEVLRGGTHHDAQWIGANAGTLKFGSTAASPLQVTGPVQATLSGNSVLRIEGVDHLITPDGQLTINTSDQARCILDANPLRIDTFGKLYNNGVIDLSGSVRGLGQLVNRPSGTINIVAVEFSENGALFNEGRLNINGFVGFNSNGSLFHTGPGEMHMTGSSMGTLGGSGGICSVSGHLILHPPTNVFRAILALRDGAVVDVLDQGMTLLGGGVIARDAGASPRINLVASTSVLTIPAGQEVFCDVNLGSAESSLVVTGAGSVRISGTLLSNRGEVDLSLAAGGSFDVLGGRLEGGGSIRLNSGAMTFNHGNVSCVVASQSVVRFQSGTVAFTGDGSFYNSPAGVVEHSGTLIDVTTSLPLLDSEIFNQGQWNINGFASIVLHGLASFTNDGALVSNGNNTITGRFFPDDSSLVAVQSGTLTFHGPIINFGGQPYTNTFINGRWTIASGARLQLPGGVAITTIGTQARVRIAGGVAERVAALQSLRVVEGGLEIDPDTLPSRFIGPLNNIGEIDTYGAAVLQSDNPITNAPGGTVRTRPAGESPLGGTIITPTLINQGALIPGGENTPLDLTLTGTLDSESQGRIEIDIGGPIAADQYDRLVISGAAQLDGTLALHLINGFVPALGDEFTILTASSLSGRFTSLDTSDLPSDIRFRIRYTPTEVILTRVCGVDFTGSPDPLSPDYGFSDGVLDAADFFFFLDQFALGNLADADLTESSDPSDAAYGVPDGALDSSDLFYFLDLFVGGCT